MGAYNGGNGLRESVESILSQQDVDLELIIVDDGSTDSTPDLLAGFSSADTRVRVLRQDNQGLTQALKRGCALARGDFIARQDSGDVSLAGRLFAQLKVAGENMDSALVSCSTRFVGPQGELLYHVEVDERDATEGLRSLRLSSLRGPAHHGSTLFRRALYEQVGGYREAFYFAQDLDLWSRLVEHGSHIPVRGIYYQAAFSAGSISSRQRAGQLACARILLECARLRRLGQSESSALARAAKVRPVTGGPSASEIASAMYFVGTCLRTRGDARARRYFREALRANPFHVKSALRLLLPSKA